MCFSLRAYSDLKLHVNHRWFFDVKKTYEMAYKTPNKQAQFSEVAITV